MYILNILIYFSGITKYKHTFHVFFWKALNFFTVLYIQIAAIMFMLLQKFNNTNISTINCWINACNSTVKKHANTKARRKFPLYPCKVNNTQTKQHSQTRNIGLLYILLWKSILAFQWLIASLFHAPEVNPKASLTFTGKISMDFHKWANHKRMHLTMKINQLGCWSIVNHQARVNHFCA